MPDLGTTNEEPQSLPTPPVDVGTTLPTAEPVTHRDFLDVDATRNNVFSHVLAGVKQAYPIENDRVRLSVHNPRYHQPHHFSLAEQKQALLQQRTLDWPIKGTWELTDKANGQALARVEKVIARVPYMTQRGTFISKGKEYTVANQQRLRPGIYARQKDNGELESHVNLLPGTGKAFRIHMEPDTGVFKMQVDQSHVPLFPVLKALGASDADISSHWGPDIYHTNAGKDDPSVLKKVFEKMGSAKIRTEFGNNHAAGIRHLFSKMGLDPQVSERNLGKPYGSVTPEVLLRASQKLMNVHRGTEESDDRDSQANQTIHSVEDLFKERILKDAGGVGRKLLWKGTFAKHLNNVPSGALTPQLHSVLLHSGLGQPISEINPVEILDQLVRVSRLGEGGIPSVDAIPGEARNVQPSQAGFIDPVLGPESEKIGVDTRLAMGSTKGSDGLLYQSLLDPKTGQLSKVSARDAVHKTLAFPGEWDKPGQKVRAMVDGKIRFVDRAKVDLVIPRPENMFSLGANLVPGFSGIKGGRLLMAGKMIRQALPLREAEAPLVQSAHPDGGSFESAVAEHVGAVKSKQHGVVVHAGPGRIVVKHDDGSTGDHELYNHFPFNLKTFIHNEPVVKPGDRVQPGQLLAKSNYTDKHGTLALGSNLRVGFLPYQTKHGNNYEDAIVISESAAKRLNSEHMNQVTYEPSDDNHVGKSKFISIYPSHFTRDQLKSIGDDGVVKPGTVVREGDPLMLSVGTRRPQLGETMHRTRKAYHAPDAQTWDHKNEGVVTDVHSDKDGIKVTVKNYQKMGVGDKMCYSADTEILTGDGWVSVKDLTYTHKIASLRPEGTLEYVKPIALNSYRHTGRMYYVRSTQIDLCVTENHMLYAKLRSIKADNCFKLYRADALYGKRYRLKNNADWLGTDPKHVVIAGPTVKAGQGGVVWRQLPALKLPVDTYVMLLGLFLSEGNTFNQPDSGSYGVEITQIKKDSRAVIVKALKVAGLKFNTELAEGKMRLYSKHLFEHFAGQGKCYEKYIPREVFSWSKATLTKLYYWLMLGDGSQTGTGHRYYTTSSKLADGFQQLCLHIGFGSKVDLEPSRSVFAFNKWLVARDRYDVSIYRHKNTPQINHGHTKSQAGQTESWIDYDGVVYCPTLPKNHVLYVRRNGKACWSGNSNRFGGKGVVGAVVPDDQMPKDEKGDALHVLLNPLGIISRTNPTQVIETVLAKIARKTGKPYQIPSFPGYDLAKFAQQELKTHGLKDTETVFDPATNRHLGNVLTGEQYFYKLYHTAETKETGRGDVGAYTAEGQPAKGGHDGAKRLGLLDINALISHGATEVLKDAKLIRGQKNDQFWSAFRMGHPAPLPKTPMIFDKFLAHLRGAGINVERHGNHLNIMALTDHDTKQLSNGELTSGNAVSAKDNSPIPGGLFDVGLTGGHHGNKWSHIKLHEALPNPVMEEPIRRILGLTKPKFEELMRDKDGSAQIAHRLQAVNVPQLLETQKQIIRSGKKSKRDDAVKLLGYLTTARDKGVHPADWMLNNVPVIPPNFRPVTKFNNMQLTSDANILYKDMFEANDNLKGHIDRGLHPGEARLAAYHALKAVTGLGDPISTKAQDKGVAGLLEHVFGKSSPKCYDDQTEILTRTGWIVFPDYHGGEVATLNPNTDAFEWQNPSTIIHQPYIGRMVKTATTQIDLLVTPNHQHWVRKRIGRGKQARWTSFGKVDAATLVDKCKRVEYKTAATSWRGKTPQLVFNGEIAEPNAFAEFVGWWLAEGWNHQDGCTAYVCQTEQSTDCAAIDSTFSKLGLTYRRDTYEKVYKGRPHRCVYWAVSSRDLVQWLRVNVGDGAGNKRLSTEILSWSKDLLEHLLVAYLGGDGERRKANKQPKNNKTFFNRSALTNRGGRFSTTSYALTDSLQELTLKIGLRLTRGGVVTFDNEKWNDQYRCTIRGWDRVVVEYKEQTKLVPYAGNVHCVTVPNGLVFVRRNGLVTVSGNSGMFQRRVLSNTLDVVGRAAITPNPSLDMDHVGLPESKAWTIYKPFIMRRLAKRYNSTDSQIPMTQIAKWINDKDPRAKQALLDEMASRPVLINRAPVWHRYGYMAAWPQLVSGETLHISPITTPGFGADFDGDAMNYSIPVSDAAVHDAITKMLPSRNLFAARDFKVHMLPRQEYLEGLYRATRPNDKKHPRVFHSKADVLAAYHRGEIDADHPVMIK